jgi:hypothetical protein
MAHPSQTPDFLMLSRIRPAKTKRGKVYAKTGAESCFQLLRDSNVEIKGVVHRTGIRPIIGV